MKLIIVSLATVFAGIVLAVNVHAQEADTTISQQKIENIETYCTENLSTLRRLHQNDASQRTGRGDLYRTISEKLMVPMNRRLAANQLDAGTMIDIAANFNDQYDEFFDAYFEYDNALTDVLNVDCRLEPVTFYNRLLDARAKRVVLNEADQALSDTIRNYGVAFAEFKQSYEEDRR